MERGREKKRGRGVGEDGYTERAQRECSVVTEVVFQAPVPFLPLAVFCLQRRRPRPWDGARTVAGSGGGGGEVGAGGRGGVVLYPEPPSESHFALPQFSLISHHLKLTKAQD